MVGFQFCVVLFFLVVSTGGMGLLPSLALGQSGWQAEWERVLEAAKKEGKVVVGIPASGQLRADLERNFGQKYKGIQLELIPGQVTPLASRILYEHRAGVRYFDVFISGPQLHLVSQGATEPMGPYMILPGVKDPKHWFGGHIWVDNKTTKGHVYAFQAQFTQPGFYNTDLVRPDEVRSYDDLLEPKWKGKIGFHDPRRVGAGQAAWFYMWMVKGEGFLRKLAQQDLFITADFRQLSDLLAKGSLALAISASYSTILPHIQAGLPVKAVPTPKEGVHASSSLGSVAIVKNPPHPHAAKVFVNWLLSKEGQEIFGRAVQQASRRFDVGTKWLAEFGVTAAKDSLTVEEYLMRDNSFEDKLPFRKPAVDLAERLLK